MILIYFLLFSSYVSYTKLEETQLCWQFTRVEVSENFPLGVKTMYRLYGNDEVYEFCHDPISPVGYSPVKVSCKWYPEANPAVLGDYDGMNLLRCLPPSILYPDHFVSKHYSKFQLTYKTIKSNKWYGVETRDNIYQPILDDWDVFARQYPSTDSVYEYLQNESMYVPLRFLLFRGNYVYRDVYQNPSLLSAISSPSALPDTAGGYSSYRSVELSVKAKAMATASVIWRKNFNKEYMPYRLHFRDDGHMESFNNGKITLEQLRIQSLCRPMSRTLLMDLTEKDLIARVKARKGLRAPSRNAPRDEGETYKQFLVKMLVLLLYITFVVFLFFRILKYDDEQLHKTAEK
jgi:hypothetical protein